MRKRKCRFGPEVLYIWELQTARWLFGVCCVVCTPQYLCG